MKNQIKTIVAALLLGTVFCANANTLPFTPTIKPYAISMYKVDGKSLINIFINKLEGTKVKISVIDKNGEIVYQEYLGKKETKFRTKLDLANLETGSYSLKVTDGKNVEEHAFEIDNSLIANKVKLFVTGISQNESGSILKVNVDKEGGTKMEITLKDANENVLLKYTMDKNQLNYRSKYNLSKLEKGTYYLEMNDGIQKEVKAVEVY
jgi:Secretion system C-terminal sorting domain